nr:uncharacterized protein LOC111840935 isoform X1 [Paramormyrops kingsleyae]
MKRFSFTPQFQLVKVQDPVLLRREISLLPHFREISQLTGTPEAAQLPEAHRTESQTTQEAQMPAEEQPGDASRMLGGDAEEDDALEEESDTVCENLPTADSLPPAGGDGGFRDVGRAASRTPVPACRYSQPPWFQRNLW